MPNPPVSAVLRIARQITVEGIVQGIGFRPFVHQLARECSLSGEVCNTSAGVSILVEGGPENVGKFLHDLQARPPVLASITRVETREAPVRGMVEFTISRSRAGLSREALISPDVCVCGDCLSELFDPHDRRHLYPFINCTNCGPRYTIITDVPYDRPKTSMASFTMCAQCQAEYDDPGDRRFHAQPNACPVCGPQVALLDNQGRTMEARDPMAVAADRMRQGQIGAVKGLGGFHLAVDAQNNPAVSRLRERKRREEKPLAIMVPDMETARVLAHISPEEGALLTGRQRPIVLLEKKNAGLLAQAVAPGNRYLGVMLPYTPLHHLLMAQGFTALVMTSGNMSEEPICIDNQDAVQRLGGVADFFLVHDRDIHLRSDDSITRHAAGAPRFVRRSRGYVPTPVFLKNPVPPVLGCGPLLKNTVCLTKGDRAFVSQHIGDLENLETLEFFKLTISHMERILDIRPQAAAHDLHPDYLSTGYAKALGLPCAAVQHHHAHIASCLAENRVEGEVIGLALDGTGLGKDGAIWGGEALVGGIKTCTRAGHLSYAAMPGGNAAVKEPWRMAVSHLKNAFGHGFWDLGLPFLKTLDLAKVQTVERMVDKGVNAPLTSSVGRLFDAVAAIAGLRNKASYDGQAAMELEMVADRSQNTVYDYGIEKGLAYQIVAAPIIRGAALDAARGIPAAVISGRFHATIIRAFADLCRQVRSDTGLSRAALSGGVFQNAILLSGMIQALEKDGFTVFTHKLCPANDGGVSLGQAAVAAALLEE